MLALDARGAGERGGRPPGVSATNGCSSTEASVAMEERLLRRECAHTVCADRELAISLRGQHAPPSQSTADTSPGNYSAARYGPGR